MHIVNTLGLAIVVGLSTLSCGRLGISDDELNEGTNAVAEDLGNLDQSINGFTARESEATPAKPLATRAACSDSTFSACSASARERVFSDCTLVGATWAGTIRVAFSGANCLVDDNDDTATRTLPSGMVVTGKRGGSMTVTTAATTAWDGTAISGGHKVTKTTAGYNFEILGINRTITVGSFEFANVSRKTTSAVAVTGTSRSDRVVNGGAIVTYHNKAEFNVSWVPTNVTWASTCKCPVSGTLTGTLSGSRTGTAVMTFTGCGTATVEKSGTTEAVTLDSCESA